jgi:hypothetical protein
VHRTVSDAPTGLELQRSFVPEKEGDQHRTRYNSCPVAHQTVWCTTRQKASLAFLDWSPTAPSCLGAIKGPPRCMEETHKHSLNILKHPDSVLAHSVHYVRDFSSIRVEDSLCCLLSSSLLLCAWVCCDLCLVCVAHPNLTLCFYCDLCCKGERDSNLVEICRKRE